MRISLISKHFLIFLHVSEMTDFTQNNLKFARLDLTRCILQELQKLVVTTTNVMAPSTLNESTSPASIADAGSDVGTTANTEETITEEPTPMEDVKSTSSQDISSNNNKQPETPPIKELNPYDKILDLQKWIRRN